MECLCVERYKAACASCLNDNNSLQLLLNDQHCTFAVYNLFVFYLTRGHQIKEDVRAWHDP